MTTHKDQLFHLGGVPVMLDVPFSREAKQYYVDPARGTAGNPGTNVDVPLIGLEEAYANTVANQHDAVRYLAGSSGDTLAAKLTWAKNYTHLIGHAAPTNVAQRARVFYAAALATTPMIDWTASGCILRNMYFFHGVASTSSLVCFRVTGGRNFFHNVHFAGIGHATGQGDIAGARSLLLDGAEENLFLDCTIGVDTIARSAANAQIELTGQATRNTFQNCTILSYADSATALMVKAASSGDIDRWVKFKNCSFINIPTAIVGGALSLTSAFNISASVGGVIILENCTFVGCTDIAATGSAASIRMLGQSSDDYSDFSAGVGLAIQPT